MNSWDQGGTIVSCSSNRSVYVDLLTAELIVDPVALNKQESFVFNTIMFSDQAKTKWVMLFCELKSVISVQRKFRLIYNNKLLAHGNKIHRWCKHCSLPTLDELKSKLKRCRRIIRGPVYLDMLGNYCVTVTRTDDIDNVNRHYYQQDGASPHLNKGFVHIA